MQDTTVDFEPTDDQIAEAIGELLKGQDLEVEVDDADEDLDTTLYVDGVTPMAEEYMTDEAGLILRLGGGREVLITVKTTRK